MHLPVAGQLVAAWLEGLAHASPVAVWEKVTNSVVGVVEAFTLDSPCGVLPARES